MRFKQLGALLLLLALPATAGTFSSNQPSTTNNDDSCDIAVLPAATLLLPYFEVELTAPVTVARTTIFTVVNTTRVPQIGRVTVWTDWAFPVMTFNTFLTGYDVQAFNVYDLLARGVIAPPTGTSNAATPGARSLGNGSNPNFLASAAETCGTGRQPTFIPPSILADMQNALTTGVYSLCGTSRVGGVHSSAIGYITIDVVATCSPKSPQDSGYFAELLYDNVLTGDYEHITPNPATGNYASGNPLVHIRAIPEGGAADVALPTFLPYTFYDRLTPAATRAIDRRQPLPSAFAARFIQGGATAFNTDYQIWREGTTGANPTCDAHIDNRSVKVTELVRFDERENLSASAGNIIIGVPPGPVTTPTAVRMPTTNLSFPRLSTSGDVGGWMYLNLNNGGSTHYSAAGGRDFKNGSSTTVGPRQSQNWVSFTMFAEGRYSASMEATMLANGCTPAPVREGAIGPGPNVTP